MGGGGHDSHGHDGHAEPIIPSGGTVDKFLMLVCAAASIGLLVWGYDMTQPFAQAAHKQHAAPHEQGTHTESHSQTPSEATGTAPENATDPSQGSMEGPPAHGTGVEEQKGSAGDEAPPDLMSGPGTATSTTTSSGETAPDDAMKGPAPGTTSDDAMKGPAPGTTGDDAMKGPSTGTTTADPQPAH